MRLDPRFNRCSIRLKGYDYSKPGVYFITLNTHEREHFLGEIVDGSSLLSPIGEIAARFWSDIPRHFPNASLGEFVVMPDHLHGIIFLHAHGSNKEKESVEATGSREGVQYIEPPNEAIEAHTPDMEPLNKESCSAQPQQEVRPNQFQKIVPGSISSIIRSFKAAVTRECRRQGLFYFQWQRNYYERIVRSDLELNRIRKYIVKNPSQWSTEQKNFFH